MKFNKNTNTYATIYTEIERERDVKGYRWRYQRIVQRVDLKSGGVFNEGFGQFRKKVQ